MSYKDFYEVLKLALDTVYTAQRKARPVGSHEILAWIVENSPQTIEALRREGLRDADDAGRQGWSWRQYLANALVRMHRDGLVDLRGHSEETPDGYFGPVPLQPRRSWTFSVNAC
jgi:hypothetical protein